MDEGYGSKPGSQVLSIRLRERRMRDWSSMEQKGVGLVPLPAMEELHNERVK